MVIPWWGIVLIILMYAYLIATDVYLHRRVKYLEKCVRKLEGISEDPKPHKDRHPVEDVS